MARIWQLNANFSGLTARGTINGYPVFTADTGASGEAGIVTAPLNPFLVGEGNLLRVEVTEKADGARLALSVEDARTGDVIDTGNAEEVSLPEGDPPHVIEITFDSELDGFRRLLDRVRPSNAETMTDFALRLRDALAAGDIDALVGFFRPKFESIAESFGEPVEAVLPQARGMVEFFAGREYGFGADDVDAHPRCEGRLWELRHRDGKALIRIEEDDGVSSLDVTAAELEDGVAIVL